MTRWNCRFSRLIALVWAIIQPTEILYYRVREDGIQVALHAAILVAASLWLILSEPKP